MFYFIITITTALALSAIGAYFSIIGLATIFPGGKDSVIIMASILEIAKIITVLWLHRNWVKCKLLLKAYLTFAVFTLMGITSLGIFGFLSKSHVEHQFFTEKELINSKEFDFQIQVELDLINSYKEEINKKSTETSNPLNRFDKRKEEVREEMRLLKEKLNEDLVFENKKIENNNLLISQLDQEIKEAEDQPRGLFSNNKNKIEKIKKSQKEEREKIKIDSENINKNISNIKNSYDQAYELLNNKLNDISNVQWEDFDNSKDQKQKYNELINRSMEKVQELKREKLKFDEKIMALETEIGPLKYVVGLISDLSDKKIENEQAVRLIIIVIMLVFDPLAILLLVAAQVSFKKDRGEFVNKTYVDLHKKINKNY